MKTYVKRTMALALTFALVIAVPFAAFTQEAGAASKKTKYVVTSRTAVAKDANGNETSSTIQYEYNADGLTTAVIFQDGGKSVYTRDAKGYETAYNYYRSNGQLSSTSTYTYKYNKKGNAVKKFSYSVQGSETKLVGTYSFTNYKNGKVKKEVYTSASGTYTETKKYNKKGDVKSSVQKGKDSKYTRKYKYKYDKKGNPLRIVCTYTWKDLGGSGSSVTTTKYKYKYDKHKNITRAAITTSVKNKDGAVSTNVSTVTYTYMKVKVPKKFLKFFR